MGSGSAPGGFRVGSGWVPGQVRSGQVRLGRVVSGTTQVGFRVGSGNQTVFYASV
jgi:hypothetical protein